jgi:hypothetical protein
MTTQAQTDTPKVFIQKIHIDDVRNIKDFDITLSDTERKILNARHHEPKTTFPPN